MYFSKYIDYTPYLDDIGYHKLTVIIDDAVNVHGAIFPYDWGEKDEHYDLSRCKGAYFGYHLFESMDAHARPIMPNDIRFAEYSSPKYIITFWPRSDVDLSIQIPNYDPAIFILGYDLRLAGYPIEPEFSVYIQASYLTAPHMKALRDEYLCRKLSFRE